MKALLPLLLAAVVTSPAAKDYGVQGTVFEIVEKDIRQALVESASEVDWNGVNDGIKAEAKTFLSRLPKRGFRVAEQTNTTWVDPSIVLTADTQAPLQQPDGTYAWKVLFAKGTRVNPLERVRPVTAMFLFDGSQPEQVELLKQVLQREPYRVVPVEAGAGDLSTLSEGLGRPIFHASDAMLARFQIRNLPSLLYPGEGERQLYLGVTAYAQPFSAQTVIGTWSDLARTAKPPQSTLTDKPSQ